MGKGMVWLTPWLCAAALVAIIGGWFLLVMEPARHCYHVSYHAVNQGCSQALFGMGEVELTNRVTSYAEVLNLQAALMGEQPGGITRVVVLGWTPIECAPP